MKKLVLSGAFFILSFALGVGFVALIGLFAVKKEVYFSSFIEPKSTLKAVSDKNKAGLEIKFKEFVDVEGMTVADFEVTNYDDESYIYWDYHLTTENLPANSLPEIEVDGKKIEQWRCGTGLTKFELKSGETKIFRFSPVAYHWNKGKSLRIGYSFKKRSTDEDKIFWSADLQITKELEKRFLIEKKKWTD